jgi:hypothetical protein
MANFTAQLKDRKLWVTLIGALVGLGILEMSEAEQAALVQAIITVAAAVGYIISVAIAQARPDPQETAGLVRTIVEQERKLQRIEAQLAEWEAED